MTEYRDYLGDKFQLVERAREDIYCRNIDQELIEKLREKAETEVKKEPIMYFEHILVPIDFSPDAEQALELAVMLAQQFQARITLLHAVHLPVTTEVSLTAYFSEMEASAERGMETYQKRVEEVGVAVEALVQVGIPFRQIIETAGNEGVDLIIMGTHGRTGVQHLMLGSVAERVVRLAPCPVLVTRKTHSDAP